MICTTSDSKSEGHSTPPIGVLFFDPDNRLVFMSETAKRLLGPTPVERFGQLIGRLSNEDAIRLLDALSGAIDTGSEITLDYPASNGEVTRLAWRVERSESSHTMVNVLPAVTEPTDVEPAHEAQKLESLGVLAGGVAHDMNNILGALIGNTGLARDNLDDRDRLMEYLGTIDRAADRASALCEQLLVYAGGGQISVTATDLGQLVTTVRSQLEATLPTNAVLELSLAETLPSTDCDPEQLQQVLFNLISNASEALLQGAGLIRLGTGTTDLSRSELDRLVLGDELSPGGFVWLEVTDDGCGMEAQATQLLFDPFYTTKTQGHGMGMASVLGVIRSHNGALSVSSAVGRGTTIKVYLPIRENPASSFEPREPLLINRHDRLTILVVDDETEIRNALRDVLTQKGHRVLTAPDGLVGTNIVDELHDEIDVAIIDLTMPTMDGPELYDQIRRRNQDMNIIFSSGYVQSAETTKLTEVGLARFLKKPYRASALLAELENLTFVSPSDPIKVSSAPHTSKSRLAE